MLYAPGLWKIEQVAEVCSAVSAPVNVLALPSMELAELEAAGARRISLGGSLAWTALSGFVEAAQRIRDTGSFSGLRAAPPDTGRWLSAADPD